MPNSELLSDVLSEFARTMVTDFPIQRILDQLVERIVEIMPISGAGVTLIGPSLDPPQYIAASNVAALSFEKLQTALSEGPCLAAYRTNEAVAAADLRTESRFVRFVPAALAAGLEAVFAFPLRHGDRPPIGALDLYRDTPGDLDEAAMFAAQTLADVVAAYVLNAQARQDLTDASDRFQASSLHDSLTGLPNRVLFAQLVDHAVLRTRRTDKKLAVLFADLDRFKEVNDAYGHQVGDELLVAVANRLTDLLRPGDTLARLAGDEFVILCEDLNEVVAVDHLADRIDAGMNRPFRLSGQVVNVTASVGIAYSGPGDDVPGRLLRDADTAMYQAKRLGGARHQVLDLREQERTDDRTLLARDLHGVLDRHELQAHYQPVVAADGHMMGVEALVRWTHPVRGPVPPSMLIPLAEESRLIQGIGRWMLDRACRDRNAWQQAHPTARPLTVAVNVSPVELLAGDYVAMVEEVLAVTGSDPSLIALEVTESVLIQDPERALLVLQDLRALGLRLALDDFGTGYSSLSYLQNFPVNAVKIDRSFVVKLEEEGGVSVAILGAIIDLAHILDLTVIAEGMETLEQYIAVAALSCEAYQGYYFAAPMPASEIAGLVRRSVAEPAFRLPVFPDIDLTRSLAPLAS